MTGRPLRVIWWRLPVYDPQHLWPSNQLVTLPVHVGLTQLGSDCGETKSKVTASAEMYTRVLVDQNEPLIMQFKMKPFLRKTVDQIVPALRSFEVF